MRRSGLIFLLCGTALCFEVKIAPPTLEVTNSYYSKWNDGLCSAKLKYVCQIDGLYPTGMSG